MMEAIISIVALIISFLSLVLSLIQSWNKSINIHNLQIKAPHDSFELLFDDNNQFTISLVNYNNRDMLLHLSNGYVCVAGTAYSVKPMYYTIKANSITEIEIEISTSVQQPKSVNYKLLLSFKYKGLLFERTCKYKGEAV